jgi:hypothetical protein
MHNETMQVVNCKGSTVVHHHQRQPVHSGPIDLSIYPPVYLYGLSFLSLSGGSAARSPPPPHIFFRPMPDGGVLLDFKCIHYVDHSAAVSDRSSAVAESVCRLIGGLPGRSTAAVDDPCTGDAAAAAAAAPSGAVR